jgi:hypothetical protein
MYYKVPKKIIYQVVGHHHIDVIMSEDKCIISIFNKFHFSSVFMQKSKNDKTLSCSKKHYRIKMTTMEIVNDALDDVLSKS